MLLEAPIVEGVFQSLLEGNRGVPAALLCDPFAASFETRDVVGPELLGLGGEADIPSSQGEEPTEQIGDSKGVSAADIVNPAGCPLGDNQVQGPDNVTNVREVPAGLQVSYLQGRGDLPPLDSGDSLGEGGNDKDRALARTGEVEGPDQEDR